VRGARTDVMELWCCVRRACAGRAGWDGSIPGLALQMADANAETITRNDEGCMLAKNLEADVERRWN
jgi:hypothetical protein